MDWMEVAVTVSSAGEEAVTHIFYQLGSKGVVVESESLIKDYIEAGVWDYHDFGEIKDTGKCTIKAYFPKDENLEAKTVLLREELISLQEMNPDWSIETDSMIVKEEDWANEWKKYFKPLRIGRRFLIKPSWEEITPCSEDIVIELDPGAAFGTGAHATTSLCLKAMEELIKPRDIVFDIGTGSGILAIAAGKLGALVQATDVDPHAVSIARENVLLNGLSDRVKVETGNLGAVFQGQADVVVANIFAEVIIDLVPQLTKILKTQGLFLASGIISKRVPEVIKEMEKVGLTVVDKIEDSGWVLLIAAWADPKNRQ